MDSLKNYSDTELFSLIAGGHKGAFEEVFRRHAPQVAAFISGFTKSEWLTDGIVQEIFMRIWFHREKLTTVGEPSSWIHHVTASVTHLYLKKLLTDNKIVNVVSQETYYGNNHVVETARFYKLASDIQRAIRELNPDEKVVYKLSREKNMKIPEIAEELSLSPNNIRNLLSSSTESVYDYLQDKGHSFL